MPPVLCLVLVLGNAQPTSPPPKAPAAAPAVAPLRFEPLAFQPFKIGPTASVRNARMAERVARDAYLGGTGVAGPLSMLGTTVNLVVEPALGAFAALQADDEGRARGGAVARSTAAAYAKTVTYMATFVGMWAISVPAWAALVLGLPVATFLGIGAATRFSPQGTQVAAGTALAMAGAGAVLFTLLLGVPWLVGRSLGALVGDRVWEFMADRQGDADGAATAQSDIDKLLRQKVAGPLPSVRAGVMLSAVAGGIWERALPTDGIPVIGPFLTAWRAHQDLSTRLDEARALAEMPPAPESVRWQILAVMTARGALISAAQLGAVLGALLAAGTGAAFLAAAFIPGWGLPVGWVVLGTGLGVAAAVVVTGLALGALGSVVHAFVPWTVALMASGDSDP